MSIEKRREELTHKTFLMMFRILIIFGLPAIIAYFAGKWFDTTYNIRPNGTLATLAIAFITSWALTIRMYLKLDKAFKDLRKEEEEEENKKIEK